jgi:alanine racemase
MNSHLVINTQHIRHNVQIIRAIIGNDRLICGVVKANAYGHGLAEFARELTSLGVERLACVSVDELAKLRQAGISAPIHLMCVVHPDERALACRLGCIPFISSKNEAIGWNDTAKDEQITLVVHIEVNSQMNRMGVDRADLEDLIATMEQAAHLQLEGIALHLANADIPNDEGMLSDIGFVQSLQAKYPKLMYHVASSSALEHYPQSLFQMVRIGLALYGYGLPNLKPVLSWVTFVSHIRTVSANTPISYGSTYRTKQQSQLAVLNVGYADGYPREFISQPKVLINNKLYPIVGSICMNQMIVELGMEHGVKLFDKVYLIHESLFDAEAFDLLTGSLSYRILSSIETSLARIYAHGL